MIFNENLFDEVLLKPATAGANKLFIVSGYATSAMAFNHLTKLNDIAENIQIELLIGMCSKDGLALSNHRGFQKIMKEDYPSSFSCSYIINHIPVHSKVYSWFSNTKPVIGFIGSANYTQLAFSPAQEEIVNQCNATEGFRYFQSFIDKSIYCNHPDSENLVTIYNDKYYIRKKKVRELIPDATTTLDKFDEGIIGLPSIKVSFLDIKGNLPTRSGLNWGQRPEEQREPNQAYIRLPAVIYRTGFFPERTIHFTVLTDDSKVLICTRAQDNGKAIHTPHNNSLIGEYFRNRLSVPNGELVTKEHLKNYGRHDIVFYKIDDETYFMDFSKP